VDNQRAMRAHLLQMFQAGIAACHPRNVLPPHLPGVDRPIVLALGKAAGEMAKIAEQHYPDARGVAIVPHGIEADLRRIDLLHAGHPVPDLASVAAAERLLAEAKTEDFVLVLLSGGASALACAPVEGLTLAAKQAITRTLLRSGAPIGDINCVRRHLSRIKGGRLRAALTLAISDTIGDCPQDIGSGPTVADPTTLADARAILARHGLDAPLCETPKRAGGEFRIVARAADLLAAAAHEAARLGYRPVILGEVEGEAREIGAAHAAIARESAPGTALISGGEVTVTVTGNGRGGPNLEYALAASGHGGLAGLAADSDGLDGTSGAAGAFFDEHDEGAAQALAANDSAAWFAARRGLFVTGPTGTNVNDLRIILVNGDSYQ
jgi:hydroxypyruvate reductase